MAGRPSAFKTDAARTAYCRLYDEAIAQSPVPVEESDVPTSFGTTHVLTAGDPAKPPLVALHAKSMSSTMWVPLLPALTATHHVRMVDAVGDINKSVATQVLSSPDRIVAWLDDTMDALAVDRAAFVGASIGTWMGVHYAMARPGRVERLALVCPAGIVSPLHTRWMLRMVVKVALRPTPQKTEWLFDSMAMDATRPRLRTDPWRPIAQQFITGMPTFRPNLREPRPARCKIDGLATSDIPVLAVIGRDETLHDGATMAERFRQRLPNAQVELVDGANHLVFIDRQDVVAEQLQKFLAAATR